MGDLVFLKNFSTLSEAEMAQDMLEQAGIHSVIQRGNLASAAQFSGAAGDADLFVLKNNLEQAQRILA